MAKLSTNLEHTLEDLQENLAPPEPTYENYFTQELQQKAYDEAQSLAGLGLAAQKRASEEFRDLMRQTMRKIEDMMTSRPAIRKEIMGQASQVTKEAEFAFQRGQRNLQAYSAASAARGTVGETMSILAKSKDQQKQQLEGSMARERIKERMARQQLYRATIARQNETIQSALSGIQSMANQQGGVGMAGLNAALGGMLGAGAGVTGLGLARGSNELAIQRERLGLDTSLLTNLTDWKTGKVGMRAGVDALNMVDQATREGEKWNEAFGWGDQAGQLGAFAVSNTGWGRKLKRWATSKAKGNKFLNTAFGGGDS